MHKHRWLLLVGAFALVAAACGDSSGDTTTTVAEPPATTQPAPTTPPTSAPATTEEPGHDEGPTRTLAAPAASISVDGDPSDWAGIAGLDLTLEGIEGDDGEGVESKGASVKAAHDNNNIFVLFTVDDDYDWVVDELHLSAAPSVMWAIVDGAGPHMGTEAEDGDGPSMGMVDIWHWELQCALFEQQGGGVGSLDEAAPGNDPECNFDDEFATEPEERYDDGDSEGPEGSGAENSLVGVFDHTNPTNGSDGTWIFEMSRPLDTGDSQDAQFAVGSTALMALAYWDADNSPEGWDDAQHAQSSNQGWIEVTLMAGDAPTAMRSLDAPAASISVDGDASDWTDIRGLKTTLEPIKGEGADNKNVTVKAAHDADYIYVLYTVDDDYDWVVDELHLSASPSVMWAVVNEAGPHMGTEAEDGDGPSMGMVDIWHWELQCAIGVEQGGGVGSLDEATPGNDPECNFDDEFATDPEERYDDGDSEGPEGSGAENSLVGVFSHTDPTNGNSGTWVFEMKRPLDTGDSQDAQFAVGSTALMALAYWDADNSPEGWDDAEHVQSSNQGWIEVTLK